MRQTMAYLAGFSLLALLVTWLGGVRHDYIYYLEQWELVLTGQNPWAGNNAYGPLHNAFALLVPLHELAPKLVQTALLLLAHGLLFVRLVRSGAGLVDYAAAFAANGLIWIAAFWYGNNDGLVAALVLLAVLARGDGRLVLAGVLLGLAALDKFYPLLLLPFFALDVRRVETRLVLAGLLTLAAGLGVGLMIWGGDMLEAMIFGVSRDATILSILHALDVLSRGQDWNGVVNLLIRLNAIMLLGVWLGALALAWTRREDWLRASVWALAAVLIAYKVGHPQFWVVWLTLVAALPLAGDAQSNRLARLALPFATALSLFQIGFELLPPGYYRGDLAVVKDYAGLVALPLIAAMLITYFRPAPLPTP